MSPETLGAKRLVHGPAFKAQREIAVCPEPERSFQRDCLTAAGITNAKKPIALIQLLWPSEY